MAMRKSLLWRIKPMSGNEDCHAVEIQVDYNSKMRLMVKAEDSGGNFRKIPSWRSQTTSYDRPPRVLQSTQIYNNGGWLPRIVDPASKLIFVSARKFDYSVFRKRLLPPQDPPDAMIVHLASLAENKMIMSLAPKTFYCNPFKRIGKLFHGPSKATRAYLCAEADVERALNKVGWRICKGARPHHHFYFANLIEIVPV